MCAHKRARADFEGPTVSHREYQTYSFLSKNVVSRNTPVAIRFHYNSTNDPDVQTHRDSSLCFLCFPCTEGVPPAIITGRNATAANRTSSSVYVREATLTFTMETHVHARIRILLARGISHRAEFARVSSWLTVI